MPVWSDMMTLKHACVVEKHQKMSEWLLRLPVRSPAPPCMVSCHYVNTYPVSQFITNQILELGSKLLWLVDEKNGMVVVD